METLFRLPITIVTGDFNADEENGAVLYLKGKAEDAQPPDAMVDTFRGTTVLIRFLVLMIFYR